jgi:hypothetical protein
VSVYWNPNDKFQLSHPDVANLESMADQGIIKVLEVELERICVHLIIYQMFSPFIFVVRMQTSWSENWGSSFPSSPSNCLQPQTRREGDSSVCFPGPAIAISQEWMAEALVQLLTRLDVDTPQEAWPVVSKAQSQSIEARDTVWWSGIDCGSN